MLSLAESTPTFAAVRPQACDPARLKDLDPGAWRELFEQYFRRMYAFAYARTGDVQAAEDIAADVFAAAVKGIRHYRDTGAPIGAWLYRIARGLVADQLERRRKRPAISLDSVDVASGNWSLPLDERTDLLRSLAKLTPDQQEVIVLLFFHDCSAEEAAEALGKRVGAIRLLRHRALAALRRQIERDRQEGREGRP